MLEQTIAAISTPPGSGGIAVIRISGADSYTIATAVFHPKNKDKMIENARGYTALFGEFRSNGKLVDEGIALCFRAPNSYTGEDVVEFNCHGNEVIAREILLACYEAGARPALPGEYTKRAFLNGRIGLTQAEAVMDVITAKSRLGAQAAEVALSGGLQDKINDIKQKLILSLGHLAAWIDYPEEDVEEVQEQAILDTIEESLAVLHDMIQNYDSGIAIKRGIRAVIVGSPNVGKSTLFNLLADMDRSIVTEIAGTTRDVVREEIYIGGMPFFISDTAGLRDGTDRVESEGIKRSYEEMKKAELIIAVFDGSVAVTQQDVALAELCRDKNAIAVINKNDLTSQFDIEPIKQDFKDIISVSAKAKETRAILENAVTRLTQKGEVDPGQPMLANERQLAAAQEAYQHLNQAKMTKEQGILIDAMTMCIEDALVSLSRLTGEDASEAVIEEVFTKFCVGK